jgi:hypothetical protein
VGAPQFGGNAASRRDQFARLDVNRNGVISLDEWHWSRRSLDQQDVKRNVCSRGASSTAVGSDVGARPIHWTQISRTRRSVQHSDCPHLQRMLSGIGDVRHGVTQTRVEAPQPAASAPRFDRSPLANSLWAVEQRLGSAERELRTQFVRIVRIAQLQAELDLLHAR